MLNLRKNNFTDSLTSRLAFRTISPLLFVNRHGRSSRFFHLEFDKKAISYGCMSQNAWCRLGV